MNLVTGLGTSRDKRMAGHYYPVCPLTQIELESMYRTSWIAGKIVDVPVEDMTREWVTISWDGSDGQEENLAAIDKAEKAYKFRDALRDGIRWGRLYGGSVTVICLKGDKEDFSKPLDITKIKKGSLQALRTIDRWRVSAGPVDQDLSSPNFGMPSYYQLAESSGIVHWSRVVRWTGREVPYFRWRENGMWDDPELLRCLDAIRNYDAAMANSGTLIEDSNVDIISAQNLVQGLAASGGEAKIQARYAGGSLMKGATKVWLLDKDKESWQQKVVSFAGLRDMVERFMIDVSGAADIPTTRLFGQSPAGMTATGESDIRNYYDRLAGDQESKLRTPFETLYEVLIRHTLGNLPDGFELAFNPLWQMSDVEAAARDKSRADMDAVLITAKVITPWLAARELRQRGTYIAMDDDDVDEAEETMLAAEQAEGEVPGSAEPGETDGGGPNGSEGEPIDPSAAPETAQGRPSKTPPAHEVTFAKQATRETGDAKPARWLADALAKYDRVAIAGGPRTGKSTALAGVTDRPTYGSDALNAAEVSWDAAPDHLIRMAEQLGPRWVIEGVQVARALRKGMACDAVVVMRKPKVAQSKGQAAMGAGIDTVLAEWQSSDGGRTPCIDEPSDVAVGDAARLGDTFRHDGTGWHVYRDGKKIGGPYKTMSKARRRLRFEGR